MVRPSDFVDGARIKWGRLGLAVVGASFFAYFQGVVSTILAAADVVIGPLSGLADFGATVVTIVVGLPAVIVRSGWEAALPFVLEAGLAGFVVGISIVLVSLYVGQWVIRRAA